jgi:hypothetical protein
MKNISYFLMKPFMEYAGTTAASLETKFTDSFLCVVVVPAKNKCPNYRNVHFSLIFHTCLK